MNDADTLTALSLAGASAHPSVAHLLRLFDFSHLPSPLREMSARFARLAAEVALECEGPEATVALRKLLEAKDAAVRAVL